MQEQQEIGRYVTDGKHTYPYNMYLDELLANGTLKFCDKPAKREMTAAVAAAKHISPTTIPPDERAALAAMLGITVGELGNMSPQELAEAKADLASKVVDGFPA